MVYDDAEQYYAEVMKEGHAIISEAMDKLLKSQTTVVPADTPLMASAPGALVAFNATMFPRLDVIRVPLTGSGGAQLKNVVVQAAEDGKSGYALMQAQHGMSFATPRGLFADCNAASGIYCFTLSSALSNRLACQRLRTITETLSFEMHLSK